MEEIEIEVYETTTGKRPFEIWLEGLKEVPTKARISMHLDRLKLGNYGDCKTL
jgi:putative component of toxin-antitoxin plasmid stabilization module